MADRRSRRPAPWLSTSGSPTARYGVRAPRGKTREAHPTAPTSRRRTPTPPRKTRARGDSATFALSDNARLVLERRYLAKDARGKLIETPEQLFRRVAHNIALAEANFVPAAQADAAIARYEEQFYELMTSLRFLPNSPTLGNAGRAMQQLSACFVLPVEDSMEGIFGTLKDTALIHQSGGGTGFAFSRLRPAGDIVASTGGIASGPVSFMRVYDAATESIKQGGTRRGANMAILSVDHPDIDAFIDVKSNMTTLQNFNISVAVTESFMDAVQRDAEYDLVNPRTGRVTGQRRAREVFRRIVENAWRNGDPGLVFLDRINRDHPTPQLGPIEATNPCGEQPLLPYESCNLGSINLARFVVPRASTRAAAGRNGSKGPRNGGPEAAEIDRDALAGAVRLCVRFLDDVIEQNHYPIPQIDEMTKQTRKIGLGVMGWADLLFQMRIRYDSEEAIALAEDIMSFVQRHADEASAELAEERGVFPAWHGSVYDADTKTAASRDGVGRARSPRDVKEASTSPRNGAASVRYRNATRTTVAPTGTLSIIADCSGGIEPAFALAFTRQHHLDRANPAKSTRLPEVNATFRRIAADAGFLTDDLVSYLAEGGELGSRSDVPGWAKEVFRTAHDIAPEWHVRMQAAFQRHTGNAVSKTINFRRDATVEDVERAYMLAYGEGCKGITVYRDGSRDRQVLSHVTARGPEQAEAAAAEIALRSAGLLVDDEKPYAARPYRRHLPEERRSITHKFRVGEQEGYLTAGLYDDGTPGEIFVNISKEGSTIRGLMDSVAVLTSVGLQYGVPLKNLIDKFRGVHFEPAGMTDNPRIPVASSLVDYIFRWLELRFIAGAAQGPTLPAITPPEKATRKRGSAAKNARRGAARRKNRGDATLSEQPPSVLLPAMRDTSTGIGCPDCGSVLVFSEGCMTCRNCGYNRC